MLYLTRIKGPSVFHAHSSPFCWLYLLKVDGSNESKSEQLSEVTDTGIQSNLGTQSKVAFTVCHLKSVKYFLPQELEIVRWEYTLSNNSFLEKNVSWFASILNSVKSYRGGRKMDLISVQSTSRINNMLK